MGRLGRLACESGDCVFGQEPLTLFALVAFAIFGVACFMLFAWIRDEEKEDVRKRDAKLTGQSCPVHLYPEDGESVGFSIEFANTAADDPAEGEDR